MQRYHTKKQNKTTEQLLLLPYFFMQNLDLPESETSIHCRLRARAAVDVWYALHKGVRQIFTHTTSARTYKSGTVFKNKS